MLVYIIFLPEKIDLQNQRSDDKEIIVLRHDKIEENAESLSDVIEYDITFDHEYNENMSGCPIVQRIEIDKNWFNKIPRAVIDYHGRKYKRKRSDFEWLWRALFFNNESGQTVPTLDHNEHIQTIQITELNTFLKQCYMTKRIRESNVFSIFFAKTYKEWKAGKKRFNKATFVQSK